ncbi:MAG: hypothetical protein GPJ51_10085 [Candidatus Heimdallarchaeota archaeon]|nr:hypothetical protein [Candidatus Heimdallarchaeota archaeon]
MRRIFSILPKTFYLTEEVDYDLLNSPHLPSKEQFAQLFNEKLNEPVDMLNFLKYLNKADYQNKTGTKVSGKKAYSQYSKQVVRIIPKLGGCIQHTGKVVKPIIGEIEQEWESFAIMQYYTRKIFEDMFRVRLKKEHRMIGDREAGLDKTKVIAFNPK